jgi:putative PIN family toxin of toxin-antitoxin system
MKQCFGSTASIGIMERPYQIVIDTNVLISAFRSNVGSAYQLFESLGDDRWQMNLSVPLVLEYEEVLNRTCEFTDLSQQEIDQLLDSLCAAANHHDIFFLWRPMGNDPDDEFLVELAVAAQADFIISYNISDLKQASSFGIQAITPNQFLQLLREST